VTTARFRIQSARLDSQARAVQTTRGMRGRVSEANRSRAHQSRSATASPSRRQNTRISSAVQAWGWWAVPTAL